MVVTELNSENDRIIEKIMELHLKRRDGSDDAEERIKCSWIIDTIYAFERVAASKHCKAIDKSMGFAYLIGKYRHYERSLYHFASEMTREIMFTNKDETTEELIHTKYPSFDAFESDKPRSFVIDNISKYDEDLSSYIQVNIMDIEFLDDYIDEIKGNWEEFESNNEEAKYKRMFSELETYYDKKGNRSSFTKSEILIFLSLKNNLVDEFKKNYIMEDTSDEELDELIENNDVGEKISSSAADMELVSEMDSIVKKTKNKKAKRLRR
ncbi:MAG: hypothetical protein IKF37_03155 [Bacilli bacterium]|nr:hypothetical protein [Bacilli bacterium]